MAFVYPPVGYCIYCGAKDVPLSGEHIIPFSLGGKHILDQASCETCSTITGAVEGFCTGPKGFYNFRHSIKLPTRRKRPQKVHVRTIDPASGKVEKVEINPTDFPPTFVVPSFAPAGVLTGAVESKTSYAKMRLIGRGPVDAIARLAPDKSVVAGGVAPYQFARMLAKIALSFACAQLGRDAFKPLVLDLILGRSDVVGHWVGGDMLEEKEAVRRTRALHTLQNIIVRSGGKMYLVTLVHLFWGWGAPKNYVVTGEVDSVPALLHHGG